ncbi:MAG: amino acid permease [Gemmatimonadetes bacterium]|nr:amino acid permease [Gemmatimonadota bacterium]
MASGLRRTLTARDVAVITVGTVIGSGIFLTPGGVLRNSGSVGVSMLVWVGGGLLTLLGALSYAELGCSRPGAGGLYAYIRDAFGPAAAFTFGWTLFVVIASGSVATLAVAAGDNLGAVMPLGPVGRKIVALTIIGGIAAMNVRGTRGSANALGVATALKVGVLAILIVALPLMGTGWQQVGAVWPAQVTGPVLSGGLVAMVSVLWAYEGWQYATFVGGEVIDPQRNFPLGLVLGTGLLLAIYVLVNVGYLAALGPDRLAQSSAVASESVGAVFGPVAARLVAIPVLVSIISAAHGLTLTAARVFHSMAADGAFFARLGDVHPRFGTPATSIIALSAWSAILALSGTFDTLLTYVVFVSWIFYGLGGACVLVFRVREPDLPRPMKVPGYPLTPILFVLSALVIVVNTMIDNPQRALIGIAATLSALPVHAVWVRRARRSRAPAA